MQGKLALIFRLGLILVLLCLHQPSWFPLWQESDNYEAKHDAPSIYGPIRHFVAYAQYARNTPLFKETLAIRQKKLEGEIKSHPDVQYTFFPERRLVPNDDYKFSFPSIEDYRIGIIVDPCRYNSPDCCINIFGTPEYMALKQPGLEQERDNSITILSSEDEIQQRYNFVLDDSSTIVTTAIRAADDEYYLDPECRANGEPHSYCLGYRWAARRSPLRPRCVDNNSSLDTLAGCYTTNGTYMEKCMQVAYSQNAFIGLCAGALADDPHCGTFLEIHMRHGSPYTDETEIISEVKLDTRNVSGYYTVTMPTTWMNDPNKVICSYYQDFFRVGSIVYINPDSPRCCCPPIYDARTRLGSFLCPIGGITAMNGPVASYIRDTDEFLNRDENMLQCPWCLSGLDSDDLFMCSVKDPESGRSFTRECHDVGNVTTYRDPRTNSDVLLYGSDDFSFAGTAPNGFRGVCPYFKSCVLTTNPIDNYNINTDKNTECGENSQFNFIGQLGRVVAIDYAHFIPVLTITFNDGRTFYDIPQDVVKLEYQRSMYEIWWVQRTPSEFIVQKRKGFNVTSPICSFDLVNDRYFPWANIVNGVPQN